MLRKYDKILKSVGIKINPSLWILIALIFAIVVFAFAFLILDSVVLGVVALIGVLDLIIGMPVFLAEKRVTDMEKNLPNALREMADIVKSGGTYEYALRELSTLNFGALSKEFEKVLVRLEEGSNFEDALHILVEDIDSDLFHKVFGIIIDSIRAGAGLSEILEDIAEDARQMYKLEQDRKAKTTMQVLFIFAAGGFIAPAIFGLVMTIVDFLISVASSTGVAGQKAVISANNTKDVIVNVVMIYIFLESLASSFMVTMMRDKRLGKVLFYFPIFLLIAFATFYLGMFVTKGLLGGML